MQSEGRQIKDMRLVDKTAPSKNFKTLKMRYGKCLGWEKVEGELANILQRDYEFLIDVALETINLTLSLYSVYPKLIFASELSSLETKGELMLSLTRESGCSEYLSGTGAKSYMAEIRPHVTDVPYYFQKFNHPVYRQFDYKNFIPGNFALEMFIMSPENALNAFKLNNINSQPYRSATKQAD